MLVNETQTIYKILLCSKLKYTIPRHENMGVIKRNLLQELKGIPARAHSKWNEKSNRCLTGAVSVRAKIGSFIDYNSMTKSSPLHKSLKMIEKRMNRTASWIAWHPALKRILAEKKLSDHEKVIAETEA